MEEIKSLELYVTINNYNNPIIKIPFFEVRSSVKKNDKNYLKAYNDINKWNTILGSLIKQTDQEDMMNSESPAERKSNNSIADEINKLIELKENNHITEEEFQQYKKS